MFLISQYFIDILHLTEKTVTLVTAKNQHRCWKVRAAHTRARVLPSLLTSLFPFTWVTTWLSYHFRAVLTDEGSKTEFFEKNIVTFPGFFQSFRHFEPIYYRELVVEREYTEDSAQDAELMADLG